MASRLVRLTIALTLQEYQAICEVAAHKHVTVSTAARELMMSAHTDVWEAKPMATKRKPGKATKMDDYDTDGE